MACLSRNLLVEEQLTNLDKNLLCGICGGIPLPSPISTRECPEHCFGKKCFEDYLTKGHIVCPFDSKPLDEETTPNKNAIEVLSAMQGRCVREGCSWTGKLADATKHEALCEYKTIPCGDCGWNVTIFHLKKWGRHNGCPRSPDKNRLSISELNPRKLPSFKQLAGNFTIDFSNKKATTKMFQSGPNSDDEDAYSAYQRIPNRQRGKSRIITRENPTCLSEGESEESPSTFSPRTRRNAVAVGTLPSTHQLDTRLQSQQGFAKESTPRRASAEARLSGKFSKEANAALNDLAPTRSHLVYVDGTDDIKIFRSFESNISEEVVDVFYFSKNKGNRILHFRNYQDIQHSRMEFLENFSHLKEKVFKLKEVNKVRMADKKILENQLLIDKMRKGAIMGMQNVDLMQLPQLIMEGRSRSYSDASLKASTAKNFTKRGSEAKPVRKGSIVDLLSKEKVSIPLASSILVNFMNTSTASPNKEKDKKTQYMTVDELMDNMLFGDSNIMEAHMDILLYTFSTFTTPVEMFVAIIQRLHAILILPVKQQQQKPNCDPPSVLQRIALFIKQWVSECSYHLDISSINQIGLLINEFSLYDPMECEQYLTKLSESLHHVEKDITKGNITEKRMSVCVNNAIYWESSYIRDFIDISNIEFGNQLTLIEHEMFQLIQNDEYLGQKWTKEGKEKNAPYIAAFIQRFNKISLWVSDSILSCRDLKRRSKILKKFVKIADHCLSLNNFESAFEIMSSLNSTHIQRLKKTWKGLSSRAMKMYQRLEEMCSFMGNFKNYRMALEKAKPPCVPYLGVHLKDLVFIEDGNIDKKQPRQKPQDSNGVEHAQEDDGDNDEEQILININKRRMLSDMIKQLNRLKQKPFPLRQNIHIRNYLWSQLTSKTFNTIDGYLDISKELE